MRAEEDIVLIIVLMFLRPFLIPDANNAYEGCEGELCA